MGFFNIKNIVAIGVLVFLGIVMICLLRWDYMWEEEYLSKWASAFAIISFGIAPSWYFWTKHQNEHDERSRASKNLYIELNDALDALDENKHKEDFKKVKIDNEIWAYFMNRGLNHDFYDSLVFSGKINFLPPKIQQEIQDVFQIIKDHNFHIRKIRDIEDNRYPNEDISSKTNRYYKKLHESEEILLERIPKIKEKLKNEFKIDGSISF